MSLLFEKRARSGEGGFSRGSGEVRGGGVTWFRSSDRAGFEDGDEDEDEDEDGYENEDG
jgi:hypothetical protein